jgi:hypothetical protein
MSKTVGVIPSWTGAWAFWAGSDHYNLRQVLARAPFELPIERVTKVYDLESKPLFGLGGKARYALEYRSEHRECFVTLEELPQELREMPRTKIKAPGTLLVFLRHSWREPTALLLPFLIPFVTMMMMWMLGLWNEYVLHQNDLLAFFANPGCNKDCVGQVLRIHSMVGFLFLVQLSFVLLPIVLLLFQAPRYRSAVNYRMIQGYSLATVVVGFVILGQLMAFFPFRQYGRFLELGFDPKVERMISNLKQKK